jgi:ATP-dependent helicase Lhr and Lhr-like helicase
VSVAFERLHPAVRHHVVNSLGWRTLRPLQDAAIAPVLAGEHALLGAPTAAGKTEAALLPLLSRMVDERWVGLSVLYVCPLRALINNLYPRVQQYADLLGCRAALWHGDVGAGERKAILRDPPDLLLTTPESLEAMLMSRTVDARQLLGGVEAVVVDEIHAFAGDDRGWHLLAVLARLDELAGRELQRIGLTATVGNPDWLVNWLACGGERARQVVMPAHDGSSELDLAVDWVETVPNAAKVISSLHRGEKRLVFADSRARVEELAAALRAEGATVFVSHSSLSRDDRRLAERAFAETRDCVIVATSTLELGIDVGDLDRVIQIGAPTTVASLLQRMGRTGRRAGTVRNCLFLATSEIELLQALALARLVGNGWVEPLEAPPEPANLVAQQLLARVLADGRVGRSAWPGTFERVRRQAAVDAILPDEVLEHMVARELLVEDGGLVAIGPVGEREYGRRHFMDVTSMFLTEPLLTVQWGQRVLGTVDPSSLATRDGARPTILLGGRAWGVGEIDWNRRLVWVEPTEDPGASRWAGSGAALSIDVCHAIRATIAGSTPTNLSVTRRAGDKLRAIRDDHWWAHDGETVLVADKDRQRTRWWTFAGARANRSLAQALDGAAVPTLSHDDLSIGLRGVVSAAAVRAAIGALDPATAVAPIDPGRFDGVKFASCLPHRALEVMLRARDEDMPGLAVVMSEPVVAARG